MYMCILTKLKPTLSVEFGNILLLERNRTRLESLYFLIYLHIVINMTKINNIFKYLFFLLRILKNHYYKAFINEICLKKNLTYNFYKSSILIWQRM